MTRPSLDRPTRRARPVADLCAARPGPSRYHCPCQIGEEGSPSGQHWSHRRIGFDELNNELQRREIASAGGLRLSATSEQIGNRIKGRTLELSPWRFPRGNQCSSVGLTTWVPARDPMLS